MQLNAPFPLTPALSPGEREDYFMTFERSPIGDSFQRGNKFTLSHPMGEGRGEGQLCCCILTLSVESRLA